MANLLLHETSPYLLQHAHNPVNWRAWNDETLALAKSQNKLILVSIGYSACHWCHVMEKQCFENQEAARIMNKYFICIKVDREERPDVDAIYMQALQLMSGQGGWPLNCFTLPDGRPVYGGTYFPLERWITVLENLQNLFETNIAAMHEYAERLTEGIKQSQIYTVNVPNEASTSLNIKNLLSKSIHHWKKHFDLKDGGTQRVPKFPMPCNYIFLLNYSIANKDHDILEHVFITLDKMSMGGLFDQIGGGFARYSTDGIWKVPHFEKMLYDNAQLVSLYSKAYQKNNNNNYKSVIEKTLNFIEQELSGSNGEYYSALDADSEGEEGKYYVWKKEELQQLLGSDYEIFSSYYNVNEIGYWEHGNYILMRIKNNAEFCEEHKIKEAALDLLLSNWKNILLKHRNQRIKPSLDDKTLTSWNALMGKGYVDAYIALENDFYLNQAIKSGNFILKHLLSKDNLLYHSYKNEKATINGFLEDYAFVADCFIALYKVTGDESWLIKSKDLAICAIQNFYDETDGLFYFNSIKDAPLIARQKEVQDNVIPASNSVMANALYEIGIYFEIEQYVKMAQKMCAYFYNEIEQYGSAYANWALLLLKFEMPVQQVAIPSNEFCHTTIKLLKSNKMNVFTYSTQNSSVLPFVADKKNDKHFYLCSDNVCGLPLNNLNELITAFDNL